MFLTILLGSLIALGFQGSPKEFKSAVDALSALDRMSECKCDTDVRAYRYFINHPDESIPVLIDFTLKNKRRHYVSVRALSKIRDERVVTFLIQLANDELNNLANTITDDELIGHLIAVLGDYGDKRAIPIIEESLERLNNQHRERDLEALCELGKISIAELYERHSESVVEIHKIASANEYSNPKFSVEVYDWIINRFPERLKLLMSCHAGKVIALYNAQEYALALRECEMIKQNIDSGSAEPITFAVDHYSRSIDEMINLLKAKPEINK